MSDISANYLHIKHGASSLYIVIAVMLLLFWVNHYTSYETILRRARQFSVTPYNSHNLIDCVN